jgi:hypothetical protein
MKGSQVIIHDICLLSIVLYSMKISQYIAQFQFNSLMGKPVYFNLFYVLLPYIIYVMPSGRFSHCPAFLSRTAKERDKKYRVKSP